MLMQTPLLAHESVPSEHSSLSLHGKQKQTKDLIKSGFDFLHLLSIMLNLKAKHNAVYSDQV